jgi:hypothetical protein
MKNVVSLLTCLTVVHPASTLAQVVSPNYHIHPNPTTHQFETSVAVHPSNPRVVLATAIAGKTDRTATSIGWYYTTDGGATWSGGDTLPTHLDFTTYIGDPAAGIDLEGNLFANGVSGSSTFSAMIARSTDGSATWTQTGVPNPTNNHKNHLTIDVSASSPFAGIIYESFATVAGQPIQFSKSTDHGASFSAPVTINAGDGNSRANAPNLAVGPEGRLYAAWVGSTGSWPLDFNSSTDGGATWGGVRELRTLGDLRYVKGIYYGGSLPSMSIDRSNGTRAGWIYIVFLSYGPTTLMDVSLIRSSDHGVTWSDPRRVNQDNGLSDQWLPWLSVDPATGNVYVVYFDSRNFAGNDSAEVYMSYSIDGGGTFSDLKLSDAPFRPAPVSVPPVPVNYGGSYIGVAALRDTVWACWYDNRSGVQQAYVSRVIFGPSTSVSHGQSPPADYALLQNYPNPFNPTTAISYQLSAVSNVSLKIFDILGREVAVLVNGVKNAGSHTVTWDAAGLPTGVYFYRLRAGEFSESKRLALIR